MKRYKFATHSLIVMLMSCGLPPTTYLKQEHNPSPHAPNSATISPISDPNTVQAVVSACIRNILAGSKPQYITLRQEARQQGMGYLFEKAFHEHIKPLLQDKNGTPLDSPKIIQLFSQLKIDPTLQTPLFHYKADIHVSVASLLQHMPEYFYDEVANWAACVKCGSTKKQAMVREYAIGRGCRTGCNQRLCVACAEKALLKDKKCPCCKSEYFCPQEIYQSHTIPVVYEAYRHGRDPSKWTSAKKEEFLDDFAKALEIDRKSCEKASSFILERCAPRFNPKDAYDFRNYSSQEQRMIAKVFDGSALQYEKDYFDFLGPN